MIVGALSTLAIVVLGLTLSYLFLAVLDDPLTRGFIVNEPTQPAPVSARPSGTEANPAASRDDQIVMVDAWLNNDGRFSATVTGVDINPGSGQGMVSVSGARAGVVTGSAPCCMVDQRATWAVPGFMPFALGVHGQRPVVLQLRFGHCENTPVGVEKDQASITVHYDVLGAGHTIEIPLSLGCPSPPTRSATPGSPPPTR